MKKTNLLSVVAIMGLPLLFGCVHEVRTEAPPPVVVAQTGPAPLSPPAAEVVRLSEAGTSEDVVLAYIQNCAAPFALNADQILYLRDHGVTSTITTAMLNHDKTLQVPEPATPVATAPLTPPPPVYQPAPAPVAAPPPVYVSGPPPDVAYFYSDLAPYGTWVELEGVGWCWQPQVVVFNRAWRPYCDSGHWLYTDAGWYWQSDYSWGWAPFHYGRWYLHPRCGWVWTPDRVWGPSWVAWRTEGDHCGWAPMPPRAVFDLHTGWHFNGVTVHANFDFGLRPEHYTFIALGDFHRRDLDRRRMEPTQVTKIYNNTTIINNYVVNNNTVINEGVRVDRVAAATHTEFRKVPVRDEPAGIGRGKGLQKAEQTTEVVYRPKLQAPARGTKMVAQKVDEKHPVIQHPSAAPAAVAARPPASTTTAAPVTRTPAATAPNAPTRAEAQVAPPAKQPQTRTETVSRPNQAPRRAPQAMPVAPANRSFPAPKAEAEAAPAPKATQVNAPTSSQVRAEPAVPAGMNRGQQKRAETANTVPTPHVYAPKSARQAAETRPASERKEKEPKARPAPARNRGQQSERNEQ